MGVRSGMLAGEEGRSRDDQRKISSQSNVSRTSMAEARKLSAMSTAMGAVDNSSLIVPAQSMSSQPVERRLGSLQEQELQAPWQPSFTGRSTCHNPRPRLF